MRRAVIQYPDTSLLQILYTYSKKTFCISFTDLQKVLLAIIYGVFLPLLSPVLMFLQTVLRLQLLL